MRIEEAVSVNGWFGEKPRLGKMQLPLEVGELC